MQHGPQHSRVRGDGIPHGSGHCPTGIPRSAAPCWQVYTRSAPPASTVHDAAADYHTVMKPSHTGVTRRSVERVGCVYSRSTVSCSASYECTPCCHAYPAAIPHRSPQAAAAECTPRWQAGQLRSRAIKPGWGGFGTFTSHRPVNRNSPARACDSVASGPRVRLTSGTGLGAQPLVPHRCLVALGIKRILHTNRTVHVKGTLCDGLLALGCDADRCRQPRTRICALQAAFRARTLAHVAESGRA